MDLTKYFDTGLFIKSEDEEKSEVLTSRTTTANLKMLSRFSKCAGISNSLIIHTILDEFLKKIDWEEIGKQERIKELSRKYITKKNSKEFAKKEILEGTDATLDWLLKFEAEEVNK